MNRRAFLAGASALMLAPPAVAAPAVSTFHRVYGDPLLRDRFFWFLQNVFHLYPEAAFHLLIDDLCATYQTDEDIYGGLLAGLPAISPMGGMLTYALPALTKQKQELARQTAHLLDQEAPDGGYLEIGTTGRYVRPLQARIDLGEPRFLLNDILPGYSPIDVAERGVPWQVAEANDLADYASFCPEKLDEAAVGLVTNFIGFHHCPLDRLDSFITAVHRVIRPGGVLVLREHDVVDEDSQAIVALAHDVFNAGTGLSWADNAAELRNFRSVAAWRTVLEATGFEVDPNTAKQPHDPTDNLLLSFRRS